MDVRLATPLSTSSEVDMSEFLSLTNPSPTQQPVMHTLHPLLPNGTAVEAELGIMSNDLEAMSAVDVSKPSTYDLLSNVEVYSTTSGGQDIGFVTIPFSSEEINMSSMSSVEMPTDCSQYYIQCKLENGMKLGSTQDSGSNVGQLNQPPVVTMTTSFPHPPADPLTVPNNFVMPTATQTYGNLRPASVIDVSTPPKKPLSPYMRFSKGVRNCLYICTVPLGYLVLVQLL